MTCSKLSTRALATVALLICCSSTARGETARGVVFHDGNNNGVRDANELGLASIRVSNGTKVVATDGEGRYELPVDDDDIVFVVKPRNWKTRLNEVNLPQFYYIHKPSGSPDDDFKHEGVAPTGALPESIDFALYESPEPDEFQVIMMGDPQPYNRRQVRFYANDVVAELVDSDAAFGISLGDIVGDDLSLFQHVNAVQGVVGVPWYNVLGNHDMNFRSSNDQYSDETYERVYGPATYAFQYGPVHFIVLDNVIWRGAEQGNYAAGLSDQQLQFVAEYVAGAPQQERIVLCMHIPMVLPEWRGPMAPSLTRLMEILSSHPHTISFSAHTHFNQIDVATDQQGYKPEGGGEHHHHNAATGSGSWYRGPLGERGFPITTMADGAPNGYIMATFSGNEYKVRYKAARMPAGYQMEIHAPDVVPASDSSVEILANVFNGSARSQLRMRVRGQGEWIAMDQTRRVDPSFAALKKRDDPVAETENRPKLPAPLETPHMWVATLPAGIPAGVYVLEVESTDMFDQVDRAVRIIEVE